MTPTTYLNGRLVVKQGDITREKVDAIVNAANSTLMGGGGVDGAIHHAGGPSILQECRRVRETGYPDGLPTGKAVMTGAGRLPAGTVIHTVGPVWRGGGAGEPALLAAAYRGSLAIAAENQISTIAFPAVSTGVFGYPKELAAVVACNTIRTFLNGSPYPETVYLVFLAEADAAIFRRAVEGRSLCL